MKKVKSIEALNRYGVSDDAQHNLNYSAAFLLSINLHDLEVFLKESDGYKYI